MKYQAGSKVVVAKQATSLYLQELSDGRCGVVYIVLRCFEDGMGTERLLLKAEFDDFPRYLGISSDLFDSPES